MFNNGQTSGRRSHGWTIKQFRLTSFFSARNAVADMSCDSSAPEQAGAAAQGLSREDLTALFADDLQRENRVAVTRARRLPLVRPSTF